MQRTALVIIISIVTMNDHDHFSNAVATTH